MSCIQCSRARCRDTVIRTGRNQVLKVALIVGVLVQGAHYPESGRSRLRCRPVCGRPPLQFSRFLVKESGSYRRSPAVFEMSCIQCSRARCRDTVIRTGRNQVLKVALIVGVLVQGAHYPESGRSRLRCRPVCGRPSHHLHHWGLRGDSRRFHGDGRHEASPGTAMRVSVGLRPRPPGDSNTSPGSPGPRTRRTHPRSPCGRGVKGVAPAGRHRRGGAPPAGAE